MSRRNMLIGLGLAGLFLFFHLSGGNKHRPAPPRSTATPVATKPFPAAAPTVDPQRHLRKQVQKPKKKKSHAAAPHEDENDKASNISPPMQHKLSRVVRLYASWPGQTSRSVLLKKLQSEEPFITEEAVREIAKEWHNTPVAFMMAVKGVTQVSSLATVGGNPNKANATVFLNVVRHFKPANGKAYSQSGVQAYTINLQIINRQWRIVAIAPEVPSSSSGA